MSVESASGLNVAVVTGGRNYNGPELADLLSRSHARTRVDLLIVGDAPGADKIARDWALDNDVELSVHEAEWTRLGKKSGPIRNQRMVDEAISLLEQRATVTGYVAPGDRGTRHCAGLLSLESIPLKLAKPMTIMSGDILQSGDDAIVIPVNCEGVMGAGLALATKKKWPAIEEPYRQACLERRLAIGRSWIARRADGKPKALIMFPTKAHWRNPSEINWIWDGLNDLCERLPACSIAVPALGCGLGGLSLAPVKSLIEATLGCRKGLSVAFYKPPKEK